MLQRREMLHIATVNPEYVMWARRVPEFGKVLAKCTTVADGWGVVWGVAILQGIKLDRVSGSELTTVILELANKRGEKVFLLGGAPGVAERAAQKMRRSYGGAHIVAYSGAQDVTNEENGESSMTIAKINAVSPDYLLVAYGAPRQDMWIEENREYLRVRVAIGVGGVLDEWAGKVAIAPGWIDSVGLKWLWRLVHEPKRFFRVLRVFQFATLVMYHKLID